jgi:alkylation response protein AidB-like acyl-CoA dehydrogenase
MNFEESTEVGMIRDQVDEFLRQEVEPLEAEYDRFLGERGVDRRLDDEGKLRDEFVELRDRIRRKSAEAGFLTMHLPEAVGGGGVSLLDYLLVTEHVNDRNPDGFHELMLETLLTPALTVMHDDEFLRERYFRPMMDAETTVTIGMSEPDHGSDITWMDTTAERDGDEWVIDGTKCWITNSTFADSIVVFARTDGADGDATGISALIVDRDNPGWELGRIQHPMGDDEAGRIAYNHFDDCRVPADHMVGDEGRGLVDVAMPSVGYFRLGIPARAVGRCQWMFEQCVEYAETRRTFGEPIGSRQFVKGMLAEMRAEIEAVRWLYRHAAWSFSRGEGERWEQSAAKLLGSRLWNDVADRAVQIHGGAGYTRSLPFEGEYRNARVTRIYDGTDEIQKRTIADEFLDLP